MRRALIPLLIVLLLAACAESEETTTPIVVTVDVEVTDNPTTEPEPTPLSDITPELTVTTIPADTTPLLTAPPPDGAVARIGRGLVKEIALSPNDQFLAVISRVGLYIYDLATLEVVYLSYFQDEVLERGFFEAVMLEWSPDGQWVAAWAKDAIHVWGFGAHPTYYSWPTGAVCEPSCHPDMKFSPDGRYLAFLEGSTNYLLKIAALETGVVTPYPIPGNKIAWSPDGQFLAVAGDKTTVVRASSWETVWEIEAASRDVLFSGDSNVLSGLMRDGSIHMWETITGTQTLTLASPFGEDGYIEYGTVNGWSPDGTVFSAAYDGDTYNRTDIVVWNLGTGNVQIHFKASDTDFDSKGTISPDFTRAAFMTDFDEVQIYDVASTQRLFRLPQGWGMDSAWRSDSRHLIVLTENSDINIWDTQTGTLAQVLSNHSVGWECIHPYGWIEEQDQSIVSWGRCNESAVWDADLNQPLYQLSSIEFNSARCHRNGDCGGAGYWMHEQLGIPLAESYLYDLSGEKAVFAYHDRIEVWRTHDDEGEWLTTADHLFTREGIPILVEWPWHGRTLAIGFGDQVEVWDMEPLSLLLTVPGTAREFNWSEDGRHLAIRFLNHIEAWDVVDGTNLITTGETPHIAPAVEGQFWGWSADGTDLIVELADQAYVFEIGNDEPVLTLNRVDQLRSPLRWRSGDRVFEVYLSAGDYPYIRDAATEERVFTMQANQDGYMGIIPVSPNLLAIAGWDGTITLWPVDEWLND